VLKRGPSAVTPNPLAQSWHCVLPKSLEEHGIWVSRHLVDHLCTSRFYIGVSLKAWDFRAVANGLMNKQSALPRVCFALPLTNVLQYQELFGICQALPGPASTKMLFSITLIHAGLASAVFAFLLWSLPGAIGMYALSLGVQKMPDRLPPIVYALLSGMNASTVGIIALAAVQVRNN
jgi:hypothetical protein